MAVQTPDGKEPMFLFLVDEITGRESVSLTTSDEWKILLDHGESLTVSVKGPRNHCLGRWTCDPPCECQKPVQSVSATSF